MPDKIEHLKALYMAYGLTSKEADYTISRILKEPNGIDRALNDFDDRRRYSRTVRDVKTK